MMDSGGGNLEQTTRSEPWLPTITPLHDTIQDMKRVTDRPREIFGGQMYAGLDPMSRAGWESQVGAATGAMPEMLGLGRTAFGEMMRAPDVANNPYVQGMLEQQANLLNRNLAEGLPRTQASMLGFNERLGGSGQAIAEGLAARGTQEALARQAAQTQMGAYQAGLGQQRAGMQMLPQTMAAGLMPGQAQIDYGERLRADEEKRIAEARYRHDYPYEEALSRKERLLQALVPVANLGQQITQKTEQPGSSLGSSLLGGAMAIGGGLGQMGGFSGLSNMFSNVFSGGAYGRALPPPPGIARAY